MINKRFDLEANFKGLQFEEERHIYNLGEKVLTSTTTFLNNFSKPFDSEMMSRLVDKKNKRNGVDLGADYYKRYWAYYGAEKAALGTRVHFYAEQMPNFTNAKDGFEQSAVDFYQDVIEGKEAIENKELRCYYKGICGTVDLVTSDENGLIIRDYKTSKELDKSFNKLLGQFDRFKDSNWNKYSLQLLVYAYIVEKATGIKAYKLEIVKLAEDGYKVVPINPDMKIGKIRNHR